MLPVFDHICHCLLLIATYKHVLSDRWLINLNVVDGDYDWRDVKGPIGQISRIICRKMNEHQGWWFQKRTEGLT